MIFLERVLSFQPNVGELTRGETSRNQDGPQNFRTPVCTRRTSKQKQIGSNKQSVEQVCSALSPRYFFSIAFAYYSIALTEFKL